MDDVLCALFFTPALLSAANVLLGMLSQLRLLRELPEISSERDFLKFKEFAAGQMYQALFQLVMYALALTAVVIAITAGGWTGRTALLYFAPTPAVSMFGMLIKPLESRIKKMPVSDEWREDFDRVVHAWMHKPFPDW